MSFYLKKISIKNDVYKEKLLCGLINKKIDLWANSIIYRIFGIKIITGRFEYGEEELKLFNLISFNRTKKETKKSLLPALLEYLKQKSDLEHYDIIPLYTRIGETYLTLINIKSYIRKNNIKNPVFISCYPHLKNICELFDMDIPFITVPIVIRELYHASIPTIEYKNLKYWKMLSHNYFISLEQKLQKGEKLKFYNEILKELNITEELQKIEYKKDIIESVNDKISLLGLKKPFVFIIPNAQSNESMSLEFWDKLSLKLHKLGYDLFFNSIPYNVPNSAYKHCHLTLEEAKYMCTKASAIIGIRCGLMDLVINNTSKTFCFYKKFKYRDKFLPELDANIVEETFTLKQLPEADEVNIHEYNAEDMKEKEILDDILLNLKNVKYEIIN